MFSKLQVAPNQNVLILSLCATFHPLPFAMGVLQVQLERPTQLGSVLGGRALGKLEEGGVDLLFFDVTLFDQNGWKEWPSLFRFFVDPQACRI